jgi:hypothetical protein
LSRTLLAEVRPAPCDAAKGVRRRNTPSARSRIQGSYAAPEIDWKLSREPLTEE